MHAFIRKPAVTKTVVRGTLEFREEISMIAKHLLARATRQFGNFLTRSSFLTHMCSVTDTHRVQSVYAGNGEREMHLTDKLDIKQTGTKSIRKRQAMCV
jgi:hypothetical protein